MDTFTQTIVGVLEENSLLFAFALVGLITVVSGWVSRTLTKGHVAGSAVAILTGLVLAYLGGLAADGEEGLADISIFSGLAIMGGSMLRDFAIVATAYGVDVRELKKSGPSGIISLFMGIVVSFVIGAIIGLAFGYRDAESLATLGAGSATYIVGPVTGSAIGASSEVIALSVAIGLVKSMLAMVVAPIVAKAIGLNNPKTAMTWGGLLGTTSGVAGGLAAIDKRLVPYGAVTSSLYTGLGCLLGPSLFFFLFRIIFG
jgi:malonate transporter MadM subunit